MENYPLYPFLSGALVMRFGILLEGKKNILQQSSIGLIEIFDVIQER